MIAFGHKNDRLRILQGWCRKNSVIGPCILAAAALPYHPTGSLSNAWISLESALTLDCKS